MHLRVYLIWEGVSRIFESTKELKGCIKVKIEPVDRRLFLCITLS